MMTQQKINSMNANENNNANTIQDQEVYDGAKDKRSNAPRGSNP